jgi:hypothetical protein
MKENIYTKIKEATLSMTNKIKEEGFCGHPLLNELFEEVDHKFKELPAKKRDIIISRIWDNLERERNIK